MMIMMIKESRGNSDLRTRGMFLLSLQVKETKEDTLKKMRQKFRQKLRRIIGVNMKKREATIIL
jgi:hypothetical protein